MSTGAKAGVGVGIGAVALIGLVSAVFLILRRRRSKTSRSELAGDGPPGTGYSERKLTGYDQPLTEFYDPKSTSKLEQKRTEYYELDNKKWVEPVELPADSKEEAARKERERIARVDARAAAGYDGAYRGN
jgi:hypothetical protein